MVKQAPTVALRTLTLQSIVRCNEKNIENRAPAPKKRLRDGCLLLLLPTLGLSQVTTTIPTTESYYGSNMTKKYYHMSIINNSSNNKWTIDNN
jgi:hypothetical protein